MNVTFITFVILNVGFQEFIAHESRHPNHHIVGIHIKDVTAQCFVPDEPEQTQGRPDEGPGPQRLGAEFHQGLHP